MMNNRHVRIVEIVGPAGAGKSTLCHALSQSRETIQLGNFPDVRKISDMPFFILNGLQMSPYLFNFPWHKGRKLTRQEFALLSILNGWPDVLQKELKNNKAIILDQGPVYMLAELLRSGPQNFRHIAARWWEKTCMEWANMIDLVICIDTSDAILMERVRVRNKDHRIKNHSDEWASQFLAQHRDAQQEVLDSMANQERHPKVIQMDTSQASLNETVEKILPYLIGKEF
jgi:thymidylate kinase